MYKPLFKNMADISALRDKAIKASQLAEESDHAQKYEEALSAYIEALEAFQQLIKSQ